MVRSLYKVPTGKSLMSKLLNRYLKWHVNRLFSGSNEQQVSDKPVFLSSMARGLLGKDHPLQMRHKRRLALKDADFVLLAGVPADFRLDYGNHIRRSATYVSANR